MGWQEEEKEEEEEEEEAGVNPSIYTEELSHQFLFVSFVLAAQVSWLLCVCVCLNNAGRILLGCFRDSSPATGAIPPGKMAMIYGVWTLPRSRRFGLN